MDELYKLMHHTELLTKIQMIAPNFYHKLHEDITTLDEDDYRTFMYYVVHANKYYGRTRLFHQLLSDADRQFAEDF